MKIATIHITCLRCVLAVLYNVCILLGGGGEGQHWVF